MNDWIGLSICILLFSVVYGIKVATDNILKGMERVRDDICDALNQEDLWICPLCKNEVDMDVDECDECGYQKGKIPCPTCKFPNDPENEECVSCLANMENI